MITYQKCREAGTTRKKKHFVNVNKLLAFKWEFSSWRELSLPRREIFKEFIINLYFNDRKKIES